VDLDFTAEQAGFRDEVRTWLAEHAPAEPRPHRDAAAMREYDLAWQRTQWDGGWAGIAWPERYGGRGLTLVQQLIWYEEYARAGLPSVDAGFVGLNHAGPTLITTATEEQKSFHLPRILRGQDVWCQGFSEPGAGSDLAALSTRAELDGDEFVVTGQKIWTSFAMIADYQELLARTDRDVPKKHNGITWLICDMRSPGIEVRPIETIEGGAEFCEVFYDEVRIPVSNVVGERDDGWRVAMSTLSFERGTAYTASQVRLADTVEKLVALAGERTGPDGRRPAIADDELARRLATARAEVAALRAMTYAGICRNMRSDTPGPEGSILKLYYADIAKRVARLAMDVLGADGLRATSRWDRPFGWAGNYLYSFSTSIGGGTSEIQRNIIGDRVLGLPR
jgi:alkylation response protein AidB-like acyl-CoA dehydrogenase